MKKFKITQERILEIANKCTSHEFAMKEAFPDAFKMELKVGKWYKTNNGWLFNYQKNSECYGFTPDVWSPCSCDSWSWSKNNTDGVSEATMQEVEMALVAEAKKRGFEDRVSFNEIEDSENGSIFNTDAIVGSCFLFIDNKLYSSGRGKWCIFKNGKWATIIQQKKMTQEEIEHELGYKIQIL